ncbi:MAG: helix-turn-helix domain-containing protein [Deltaproteobacteria bacterium]|nr:helix-turn-helix domain-containing protein [Deltaproteobacteria bacterium]
MNEKEHDITTEDTGASLEKPDEGGVVSEEALLDLKEIRRSRGLTLKDVSTSTKISPPNLKAIEEQRFDLLPEPIYARAFIDMYAKVLDVDGEKILSLYDDYLRNLNPEEDKYEVLKTLAAKRRHLEVWIWMTIVSVLLVMVGAFYLYQWSTRGSRTADEKAFPAAEIEAVGEPRSATDEIPVPASGDTAVEEEQKPPEAEGAPPADLSAAVRTPETGQATTGVSQPVVAAEQPVAQREQPAVEEKRPGGTAAPDMTVPPAEKPYTVVIEASELTWIQIDRDGGPPFEVMLRPGERTIQRASERFDLLIGNAGGVDIRFQGRPLGPLGGHGQVVRLILPPGE